MTTEFDRLQAAWSALEQRVDAQDARLLQVERASRLDGLRRRLRPAVTGQWLQLALGVGLALLGGAVWPDGRGPLVTASAIVIQLYGIACIAWGVVALVGLARLDYTAPVIALQAQLLRLQRVHLIGNIGLGLVWWILWIPFAITVFGAVGGRYPGGVGSVFMTMVGVCIAGFLISLAGIALGWRHPRVRRVLQRTFVGERLHEMGEELAAMH
ncbi:hypothetical protein DWG18_07370 [Lysobacter sp. TY2-98]|uniref:hypothetical protein n=1 Tax=Lysobacter sp. TY2-98 TaxID=2290922 RepID=UPI000E2002F4|nr:hypothetical protein [Lysobacter sp. TY2-98]AXK72118.1 hypothetical protein DWG18_07370 [Lysobacter sp. TY2-98]